VSLIVQVSHIFNGEVISGLNEKPVGLLTNNSGAYFAVSDSLLSYHGLSIFRNNSLFKLLDSINFSGNLVEIINSPFNLSLTYTRAMIKYFFMQNLVCDVNHYFDEISFDFDFRHLYDSPEVGRIYEFTKIKNILVVKYSKYSDSSLTDLEDYYCVGILIENLDENTLFIENNWLKKDYDFDKNRNENYLRYVNRAIRFKLSEGNGKIFFSDGRTETECIEKLKFYKNNFVYEHNPIIKHSHNLLKSSYHDYLTIATKSLSLNLQDVVINNKLSSNIFAGWPWFFQFWTRDSLISLGGLIALNKFEYVQKILHNYLNKFDNSGLLNSRIPTSTLKSLDSTGWFFKRLYDLIYTLIKKNKLFDFYNYDSLNELYKKLSIIFDEYISRNMKNGLIYSGKNETWMDTDHDDSGRAGYCVEIQFLTLSMIKTLKLFALLLNKKLNKHYLDVESKLILNMRKRFYKNGILADKITDDSEDFTSRNNIFLARYIYSHVFSDVEWEKIFANALDKLWLPWGGIASIDKNHALFCSVHTGSNNNSYHRGDSWYFINNIAAIELLSMKNSEFNVKAKLIFEASIKDMLFNGALGCCSEISSAKEQRAEGCLNQSWSAATLIELIHYLNNSVHFLKK